MQPVGEEVVGFFGVREDRFDERGAVRRSVRLRGVEVQHGSELVDATIERDGRSVETRFGARFVAGSASGIEIGVAHQEAAGNAGSSVSMNHASASPAGGPRTLNPSGNADPSSRANGNASAFVFCTRRKPKA